MKFLIFGFLSCGIMAYASKVQFDSRKDKEIAPSLHTLQDEIPQVPILESKTETSTVFPEDLYLEISKYSNKFEYDKKMIHEFETSLRAKDGKKVRKNLLSLAVEKQDIFVIMNFLPLTVDWIQFVAFLALNFPPKDSESEDYPVRGLVLELILSSTACVSLADFENISHVNDIYFNFTFENRVYTRYVEDLAAAAFEEMEMIAPNLLKFSLTLILQSIPESGEPSGSSLATDLE